MSNGRKHVSLAYVSITRLAMSFCEHILVTLCNIFGISRSFPQCCARWHVCGRPCWWFLSIFTNVCQTKEDLVQSVGLFKETRMPPKEGEEKRRSLCPSQCACVFGVNQNFSGLNCFHLGQGGAKMTGALAPDRKALWSAFDGQRSQAEVTSHCVCVCSIVRVWS